MSGPPFKRILTLDYETRWDSRDYTLKKLTTEEYIRDKRFKAFGACAHFFGDSNPTQWVRGVDLPAFFETIDWSSTAVLAHNAQFDATILSWRYGISPCFILDTLSMARATRGIEAGNSLAKLAASFDLPPKGNAVHSTDGLVDLPPHIEAELADYCAHDVWLAEQVFQRMIDQFPPKELRLIDMTVRMYTEPLLELDKTMLTDAVLEEREKREGLLQRLGVQESVLASNDQFADLLQTLGVEPPTKVSKQTGKTAWAFAKNDAHFQALCNGDIEEVALLCEARLKVKSTISRTRAQRFLDIGSRGPLPVPLSYFGAGTGRWTASKGSAINMQNLSRGSALRKAIMAPQDHEIIVGDLSQIEPRVLAWLSDYHELLDIFRSGKDVYATFGAQMFNIPNLTQDTHPIERQAAKSALLGCGYGLGWASFAVQLMAGFMGAKPVRYGKDFAKALGVTAQDVEDFLEYEPNVEKLMAMPRTCTLGELIIHCVATKAIIDKYRSTARPVVAFWDLMSGLIESSLYEGHEVTHKCLTFRKEQIILPSGMPMNYPNLRFTRDAKGRKQWVYDGFKNGRPVVIKLYGGKVTNNVTQGSARCVMTDGMLRVQKRYPVKGTVHDELIAIARAIEAEQARKWVLEQMTLEPPYMPGIPLGASGGNHRRYGMAKN